MAERLPQAGERSLLCAQLPAQQRLGERNRRLQRTVKVGDILVGDPDGWRQDFGKLTDPAVSTGSRAMAAPFAPRGNIALADDVLRVEGLAEEARGEVGNQSRSILPLAALHGGAGGDAVQLAGRLCVLLQSSHQAGHVGAALAGVGVHFVQHQEAQHASVLGREEDAVLEAGQQ